MVLLLPAVIRVAIDQFRFAEEQYQHCPGQEAANMRPKRHAAADRADGAEASDHLDE